MRNRRLVLQLFASGLMLAPIVVGPGCAASDPSLEKLGKTSQALGSVGTTQPTKAASTLGRPKHWEIGFRGTTLDGAQTEVNGANLNLTFSKNLFSVQQTLVFNSNLGGVAWGFPAHWGLAGQEQIAGSVSSGFTRYAADGTVRSYDGSGNPLDSQETTTLDTSAMVVTDHGDGTTKTFSQVGGSTNWFIVKIQGVNGATTTFNYGSGTSNPPLLSSIADPLGHTTTFSTAGGLVSGITSAAGYSVAIAVDSNGHLSGINMPEGNYVVSSDAASGDLVNWQDPTGGYWAPSYYDGPDFESATDSAGRSFRVDPYATQAVLTVAPNRITRVNFSNGDVTAFQDERGLTTTYVRSNHDITSMKTPDGSTTAYTYDAYDRLLKTTHPDNSTDSSTYATDVRDPKPAAKTNVYGDTTTFAYSNFQLAGITDASGKTLISLGYDGSGRLTSITNPAGETTNIGYGAGILPTSTTSSTGRVVNFAYDTNKNLNQASTTGAGSVPLSIARTSDAQNRTLSFTSTSNVTYNYTYDTAARLSQLSGGGVSSTYSWDALMRRIGYASGGYSSAQSFGPDGYLKTTTVNGTSLETGEAPYSAPSAPSAAPCTNCSGSSSGSGSGSGSGSSSGMGGGG